MKTNSNEKLTSLSSMWWFFAVVVLIQFLPPVSTANWSLDEFMALDQATTNYALVSKLNFLYLPVKLAFILMVVVLFLIRNKARTAFSLFVGFHYLLFYTVQLIGFNHPNYGTVFNTGGFVMIGIISFAWFSEIYSKKNGYSKISFQPMHYFLIPASLFAFWLPERHGLPHLDPLLIFSSAGGLALCMMLPVYITLQSLFYPHINLFIMRVSGIFGLLFASYNIFFTWGINFSQAWWGGIMHLPMLFISIYALIVGYRKH
ncbi:MAG: hypothetical protein KKG99_15405 [Bacteroidetes bacterium]|nr:hypothetical protein [Bacteroidota bacterium]